MPPVRPSSSDGRVGPLYSVPVVTVAGVNGVRLGVRGLKLSLCIDALEENRSGLRDGRGVSVGRGVNDIECFRLGDALRFEFNNDEG